MNAILWDGHKQLHGYLEFGDTELTFRLRDFSDTSLHLAIPYVAIVSVQNHKIFRLTNEGIVVLSKDGKRNVFVVEDGDGVRKEVKKRMN